MQIHNSGNCISYFVIQLKETTLATDPQPVVSKVCLYVNVTFTPSYPSTCAPFKNDAENLPQAFDLAALIQKVFPLKRHAVIYINYIDNGLFHSHSLDSSTTISDGLGFSVKEK